ncbi:Uncharacterised protein [Vibrio cholerae]|nr:Uncharacterised protein [Vibrio cholerae]CSI84819.1 Uncharacterised protein [Vibrio cholerae]
MSLRRQHLIRCCVDQSWRMEHCFSACCWKNRRESVLVFVYLSMSCVF